MNWVLVVGRRVRHGDQSGVGDTGCGEEMVGLVHETVERIVEALPHGFHLFPRCSSGNPNEMVGVSQDDSGKRLGNDRSVPAVEPPAAVGTPHQRQNR